MNNEILLIDDDDSLSQALCEYFENRGFNPSSYEKPSDAIKDLSQRDQKNYPLAYLVDMRIPQELGGSEEFFYFIKDRGSINHFYFITGAISEHDEQVIERSGAKIIQKTSLIRRLPDILKELSHSQLTPSD